MKKKIKIIILFIAGRVSQVVSVAMRDLWFLLYFFFLESIFTPFFILSRCSHSSQVPPWTLSNIRVENQVPVAHVCNPSYSGGRDQEDYGSNPAQANSLRDPISMQSDLSGRVPALPSGRP
jgi:hypothetical protein